MSFLASSYKKRKKKHSFNALISNYLISTGGMGELVIDDADVEVGNAYESIQARAYITSIVERARTSQFKPLMSYPWQIII